MKCSSTEGEGVVPNVSRAGSHHHEAGATLGAGHHSPKMSRSMEKGARILVVSIGTRGVVDLLVFVATSWVLVMSSSWMTGKSLMSTPIGVRTTCS